MTLDPKGGKHDRRSMAVEISPPGYLDKIEYQVVPGRRRTTAQGSSLFRAPPAMIKSHVVGSFDPSDANNHYYYYWRGHPEARSSDKTRSTIVSGIRARDRRAQRPAGCDGRSNPHHVLGRHRAGKKSPTAARSYMYSVPSSFIRCLEGDDNVNYYGIRLGTTWKQEISAASDQGRTIEREFDLRLTAAEGRSRHGDLLYHRMPDGRYSAASNTVSVPFRFPERSLLPVTSGNAVSDRGAYRPERSRHDMG